VTHCQIYEYIYRLFEGRHIRELAGMKQTIQCFEFTDGTMINAACVYRSLRRRIGHGVRTWDPAEEKAATEPHHVLWRPTGGAGAGLPEDAVPGRLHTRGTSPAHRAHRGQDTSKLNQ